jgi:hypothetical protein
LIDKREILDLTEQTPLNPHVRLWLRSLGCVTRHVAGNRTGSIRGIERFRLIMERVPDA